jgi:tetratricopeptide (TPR) repeat protein
MKNLYIVVSIVFFIILYLFSSSYVFAVSEAVAPPNGTTKSNTIISMQDKIDKLTEELNNVKNDLHKGNIDAFNKSSDSANKLINWVGIVATIYGIIIAIASLFVGYVSIRNQWKSKEALKTLEGAKKYVDKKLTELDNIIERKNEEINKKLDDFLQLSLEQLTQDTQTAVKKVKEIEEKGITTEASKKIELLERKIKIFEDIGMPNDPKVLYSKAMLYKEKKQPYEALELLHKATQCDPQYENAYFQIGYIQDDLKEYDKAIAAYEKAIELNPKYNASWNNKAVSLEKLGRLKEALDSYNKAIELNPENALYYKNKIRILDETETNIDELLKSYDSLILIEPNKLSHYLGAGRLLNTLGRTQDSAKYYKWYLDLRKKKIATPEANESDYLCYYEALILNENFADAVSIKSKMDNVIKSERGQIIYKLSNIFLLLLEGQVEPAQTLTQDVIKLIDNNAYSKLNWDFMDINPILKNKLDEKKYEFCINIQKAAAKEEPLDSKKLII